MWKTREGKIVIYGSVINVAIGAAALLFPGIFPAKGIFAGLFLVMPVALVMHIKAGYHDKLKPSIFNAALLIVDRHDPARIGLETICKPLTLFNSDPTGTGSFYIS